MQTTYHEIYLAQHGKCFYCGLPMGMSRGQGPIDWTRDHFWPKAGKVKGGKNNTVLAHFL